MKILTGIRDCRIDFRIEPFTTEERLVDNDQNESFFSWNGAWAIFFVIQKDSSRTLIDYFASRLEQVKGSTPGIACYSRGIYASIIFFFYDDCIDSVNESDEPKLWSEAMTASKKHMVAGTTLFSAQKFFQYDKIAFIALAQDALGLSSDEYVGNLEEKKET